MRASWNEMVGYSGENLPNDSGVEEGDVCYPEHAKDEGAHKQKEVCSSGLETGLQTRNVDLDIRKLVLEVIGEVHQPFVEL